ncbi:MAG: transketolase [Fastidiosipilaceae bacterium]|jgi:transketolase|nr:transketolase [Clostridiaceae bacterium]
MREYLVDLEMVKQLEDKATQIRKDLLNFIYRIGMGHLGGELSVVEVAVALYYKYLNYDVNNPEDPKRDRVVLSKAHCSETLYTIFSDLGAYSQDYMVEHFECLEKSKFGMHCNRLYLPQIEASAGSLGHGLPIALGMALGARKRKENHMVYVIVGDGELCEGSNWEAIMAGGHYELGNLVCIVDKNQLSMTGNTKDVMNIDPLGKKFEAFNWRVMEINGNNMYEVCEALQAIPPAEPEYLRKPIAIIANTVKGKGVDFMEGESKWHGGGIAKAELDEALKMVERNRRVR